jgi:hypothetical protein
MKQAGLWMALTGLAVGVPLLAMVTWARRNANNDLARRGQRTEGRIVEARHEGDKTRQTRVTYRFTPHGSAADVTGQGVYASHLPLAPGETVSVVYLPKLPAVSGLADHLDRRVS